MEAKHRKRVQQQYGNLGHTEIENFWRKQTLPDVAAFTINQFFTVGINKLRYFLHYVSNRLGTKIPFPKYNDSDNGIYTITNHDDIRCRITFVSDWATDTAESDMIAQQMRNHKPHYTIHGGDIYYVGDEEEVYQNFTAPHASWCRGSSGSFALAGNHEMYSNGYGFYKNLLPTLGIHLGNGIYNGQQAGYFCLQNNYWRIIGLDTAYFSVGKPLLEFTKPFAPDCRLHTHILHWLEHEVKINNPNDKRGIVVLTHHPYFTAFMGKSNTTAPAKQLAKLIGTHRKVIWLWGHEHKFAMYEQHQCDNGITCYGRCLGHGGMPVELDAKHFKPDMNKVEYDKLIAFDSRLRTTFKNKRLGFNGYAMLELNNRILSINYYDIRCLLLTEQWIIDTNGEMKGEIILPTNAPLLPMPNKTWADAVK